MNKTTSDACMTRTAGTHKQASGILVYLMEELGDARLRCAELKKYVKEITDLIEKSDHRDHFFEVAGHLIHGVPDSLLRLDNALDASAMAASRLDYEEIKNNLRPEKADELENVLQDVRLRYLNRRSNEETTMGFDQDAAGANKRVMEQVRQALLPGWMAVKKNLQQLYPDFVIETGGGRPRNRGALHFGWDVMEPSGRSSALRASVGLEVVPQGDDTIQLLWTWWKHNTANSARPLMGDVEDQSTVEELLQGRFPQIPSEVFHNLKTAKTTMNAKSTAYVLNRLAAATESGGRVPTKALATLIAKLERQDKQASSLVPSAARAFRNIAAKIASTEHPSRVQIASVLRRILADTMEMPGQQPTQQQAGAGEDFQKANPAITDEEAAKIDEMHEKHKDVVKDKNAFDPWAGAGEDFQKANPKITDEEAAKIDEQHAKNKDNFKEADAAPMFEEPAVDVGGIGMDDPTITAALEQIVMYAKKASMATDPKKMFFDFLGILNALTVIGNRFQVPDTGYLMRVYKSFARHSSGRPSPNFG